MQMVGWVAEVGPIGSRLKPNDDWSDWSLIVSVFKITILIAAKAGLINHQSSPLNLSSEQDHSVGQWLIAEQFMRVTSQKMRLVLATTHSFVIKVIHDMLLYSYVSLTHECSLIFLLPFSSSTLLKFDKGEMKQKQDRLLQEKDVSQSVLLFLLGQVRIDKY